MRVLRLTLVAALVAALAGWTVQPAAAGRQIQTTPTVTITPIRGEAGASVQVSASGFPANTQVDIGAGLVDSEYDIVGTATTSADGTLETLAGIPGFAQPGQIWVIVVAVQGNPMLRGVSNVFAVTEPGGPSATYTVQPGDNLSRIAARFGTTVAALLQANPNLADPSLIFPGQQLVLPSGAAQQPRVAISPLRGAPGTPLQVQASSFPANTALEVGIAPHGIEPQTISSEIMTNEQGVLTTTVTVPGDARPGSAWVVTVETLSDPQVSAVSNIFAVVEPEAAPGSYVVQPGDNLFRIAQRFGTTVDALVAANPSITNPSLIFVGQELVIPNGQAAFNNVSVYLVAIGQGNVGCNDALVAVSRQVPAGVDPLRAAIEEVLQGEAESGLYNVFDGTDLSVESIDVSAAGRATIRLTGELVTGGVCDDPRVEAQLEQTALQFPNVNEVEVLINGETLDSLFDMSG